MSTEDELGILRVLSLYCHVIDDRALDRLGDVFTEDATFEPPKPRPFTGLDEIRAYYRDYADKQPVRVIGHYTLDSVIDLAPDGQTAHARSKGLGFRADMGFVLTEYRDDLQKTPAGWRIRHRRIFRKTRFSTDPA
jgi:ketosteroid isomerase-like protein